MNDLRPHLMFVPTVTHEHGERFADQWIKRSFWQRHKHRSQQTATQ